MFDKYDPIKEFKIAILQFIVSVTKFRARWVKTNFAIQLKRSLLNGIQVWSYTKLHFLTIEIINDLITITNFPIEIILPHVLK